MHIFDYFVLFVCIISVLRGVQLGFFSSFIGIFGWLFGFYLAANHYQMLVPYLGGETQFYYPWLHQLLLIVGCLVLVWLCKLFLKQVLVSKSWPSRMGGGFLNLMKTLLVLSLLWASVEQHWITKHDQWPKQSVFVQVLKIGKYLPDVWYQKVVQLFRSSDS